MSNPHVLVAYNEVQPDGILRVTENFRGQSHIENGILINAPELVIEVSSSSLSFDLRQKHELYQTVGVQELLIVDVRHEECHRIDLQTLTKIELPDDGLCRIRRFPGLWINIPALFRGDGVTMNTTLQQGLSSPEHATFVDELAKGRIISSRP